MRVYRMVWALILAGPLWGQSVLKLDTDEFLSHAKTWQLPEYPQKSVKEHHSGVVAATVDIDDTGHVTGVNITSAPDVHLGETVRLDLAKWVFRPFTAGGKARPAESNIYIQFRLHPVGPNVMIPGLTKEPEATIEDPHRHPEQ